MPPKFTLFFALTALISTVVSQDAAVKFTLPATPDKAFVVPQGYIGFGIEMKSFPDYLGRATPNKFSHFLLAQLSNATNSPIHIRVGGTSMDNTKFSAALTDKAIDVTGDSSKCRLHTNITIGAPWVQSFAHFPASLARYTLGIPLARKDVSNGVQFAAAAVRNMPGALAQLDALELGNEPNFYPIFGCGTPDRPKSFGPPEYAVGWNGYAASLKDGVPALKASPRKDWFQTFALSSSVDLSLWDLSKVFTRLNQGGFVKTVSQHYYQADASGPLKAELLTHSTTVSKMEGHFRANVDFTAAHNVAFVLGEVGSAIGGNGTANPQLDGTLGGALWTLDFLLYGMTMGITRVSMQLGTGFRIAAWQPIDGGAGHPKAVAGNYYGLVAGAKFIGSAGDFKIRQLPMDDHPDIVGYAGYNAEKLTKIAVLNLQLWNGGPRAQKSISLKALGADVKRVRVSRLTSTAGAASGKAINFGGKHFSAENDGTVSNLGPAPTTASVVNGAVTLTVAASQAIVVEVLRT
ncbi:hypothetical protein C8R46DRAFT_1215556 [Mycena filopes]|nr:hypothetical protein C8R46DRAFT_1215556 [Mycena filopes]